jgi:hypothetical protein
MLLLGALLVIVGLVMLVRPALIWSIGEQWKSSDATEPSALYILSTRFGGVMCLLVGIGVIAAYTVLGNP